MDKRRGDLNQVEGFRSEAVDCASMVTYVVMEKRCWLFTALMPYANTECMVQKDTFSYN